MARRIVYEANPSMAGAPSYWLPAHFTAHGGDGSAEGTGSAPAMKGGGGGGGGGGVFLLVDTLSPVNGSTAITVSARGGWGGDAYDVGSSAAADGGSGGSGGQVWVAYCVGPTPTAEVFGAPGGGGALGGASGATGSNGSAYLLSMIGR
jgi:hypothetical protein